MSNLAKTSRRAVLRGLAIAPAAVAGGAVAGTAYPKTSRDAELLSLVEIWKESDAAFQVAIDLEEEISEGIDGLPLPAALVSQETDDICLRHMAHVGVEGDRWYASDAVAVLRVNYVDARPNPWTTDEAGFRRAAEIVAAHDARVAERNRRAEAAGLPEIRAEMQRLREITESHRHAIASLPAVTMEGILAKTLVAAECAGGLDSLVMDFEKEFSEAPSAPDTVMVASLLVDLTRMAGGAT